MYRKPLMMVVIILSFLALSKSAFSTVSGTWEVYGTVTARVTIRGHSGSSSVDFADEFTFEADGQFSMIDFDGTWTETKRNFWVFIDSEELEDYFEENFYDQGLKVRLTVTKNVFKGKANKLGSTISGKWNLKMSAYFYDYGLSGKISVVTTFAGTRASSLTEGKERQFFDNALWQALLEEIQDRITGGIAQRGIQ